jgi:hypothetical protein
MWTSAKYVKGTLGNLSIEAEKEDNTIWQIPIDATNTDYQNIMKLVEEGNLVIAPAE